MLYVKKIQSICDFIFPRGTFRLQDIYSLANKDSKNRLEELAKVIQPDDACNIQFTSVRFLIFSILIIGRNECFEQLALK